MRTIFAAAIAGIALVAAPAIQATQDTRASGSLERDFVTNGRINMDLSAGEYRISNSPDNRIRMTWRVRYQDDLPSVVARAKVSGSDARIDTDGPTNGFEVAIQVPTRSDLYVRLTAGELRVEHIEGNKDVEAHAGELHIDVDRAEDYHSVDASVWAGEIHAQPYRVQKEGLFRSFDWKGHGPYKLHAKLKAGEVWLSGKH